MNIFFFIRSFEKFGLKEAKLRHQVDIYPRDAKVARLTPDQKVACSNNVGFNFLWWKNTLGFRTAAIPRFDQLMC